jgi:XRE family aerobic/anaerobic benzoate catabolism transcriptional regulator
MTAMPEVNSSAFQPIEDDVTADSTSPSEPAGLDPESLALLGLLAANIRRFRSQRGMTRKGLAEQSGVSVPHLARMESAQGNASALVLAKIAKALNVPMTALFNPEEQNSGDLAILLEFLRRQPASRLARIRQQLFADAEQTPSSRAARIALVGLRGAGKSNVGRLLADQLQRPFVELNAEVEREAGMSLQEVLNLYGQTGYRRLERDCLERIASTHPEVVLATAGGLVAEPSSYELLLSTFYTVWLRASPQVHFSRVLNQHDARIARPELYAEAMDNINKTLGARDHLYRMANQEIDTSELDSAEVVARIIASLAPSAQQQ